MESLSKNKFKQVRLLRKKKYRDETNLFVVEGSKMTHEILANWPSLIEFICTTNSDTHPTTTLYHVSDSEMKELSNLSTPTEFLAVVRKPTFPDHASKFILALDGIQDPGNLGTIIRTCDWFGIQEIVCSKETADAYNSKVVQSTMGSIFRVPIRYVDLHEYLRTSKLKKYATLLEGENIYSLRKVTEGVIIMGNEGSGIREELLEYIDYKITIPQFGHAESLNVSVATAVVLSEFARPK